MYGLICCDSLHCNPPYTHSHATLDQKSWLDHFFVSTALFSDVVSCDTLDRGDNLSDHLPVSCVITAEYSPTQATDAQLPRRKIYRERWDKADLGSYYAQTGLLLQSLSRPYELCSCMGSCKSNSHQDQINKFYIDIVSALQQASASSVPKIPLNVLKPY